MLPRPSFAQSVAPKIGPFCLTCAVPRRLWPIAGLQAQMRGLWRLTSTAGGALAERGSACALVSLLLSALWSNVSVVQLVVVVHTTERLDNTRECVPVPCSPSADLRVRRSKRGCLCPRPARALACLPPDAGCQRQRWPARWPAVQRRHVCACRDEQAWTVRTASHSTPATPCSSQVCCTVSVRLSPMCTVRSGRSNSAITALGRYSTTAMRTRSTLQYHPLHVSYRGAGLRRQRQQPV